MNRNHRAEVRTTQASFLSQLLHGSAKTQLVYIAAKLGIAELLADGPKGSEELASRVGAHPTAFRRVMRALTSLGVFDLREDGSFGLTEQADLLRTGIPGSLRTAAIVNGEEWVWRAWGELFHNVMTGQPGFEHVFGQSIFDYFERNPDSAEPFYSWMTDVTAAEGPSVVNAYDFSGFDTVVDLGGGWGKLIAMILSAYPHMRGILVELPLVVEIAKPLIESDGVKDRCELAAMDFFKSVPRGGDIYILKRVIRDWDDERAVKILRNCRRGMDEKAKILVAEVIIPEGPKPHYEELSDVFLMLFGGVRRSRHEYERLMDRAGFRTTQILKTESTMSLIEGVVKC